MCIGVPMRIVHVTDGIAVAERHAAREKVNVMLIANPQPGDWVLVFQGSAVKPLSPDEAALTNDALEALAAAMRGADDADTYFADLTGREPELPPHLRKVTQ